MRGMAVRAGGIESSRTRFLPTSSAAAMPTTLRVCRLSRREASCNDFCTGPSTPDGGGGPESIQLEACCGFRTWSSCKALHVCVFADGPQGPRLRVEDEGQSKVTGTSRKAETRVGQRAPHPDDRYPAGSPKPKNQAERTPTPQPDPDAGMINRVSEGLPGQRQHRPRTACGMANRRAAVCRAAKRVQQVN